eukprot:CAMPEP_0180620984 /NCGR_PEP_ID=MMETSP1037_2-20121125/34898_1 /TAXON_ID=632150 /ORGANISM="Azadinium spinosum, Strain 3D9" /LENGTH=99 /DNA_ID=CAMNT_0022641113 /DNA_START=415 /DNA_END=714 /DNA_ORIENTATION=+
MSISGRLRKADTASKALRNFPSSGLCRACSSNMTPNAGESSEDPETSCRSACGLLHSRRSAATASSAISASPSAETVSSGCVTDDCPPFEQSAAFSSCE